jgi:hypothetical protein
MLDKRVSSAAPRGCSLCTVRIDRLQIICTSSQRRLPSISKFRTVTDTIVRAQTTIPTYRRCRQLRCLDSDCKVFWQYDRVQGWLPDWKLTIVPDDKTGVTATDLTRVTASCRRWRFISVEVAVDFDPDSKVDRCFVLRHAKFGKSRRQKSRWNDGVERYGSRKSGKLVRCYFKDELDTYRVELQLHGRLLKQFPNGPEALFSLHPILFPKHFSFVAVQWKDLRRYLRRRLGKRGFRVYRAARLHQDCLQDLESFLRKKDTHNVHRFLRPIHTLNEEIEQATSYWCRQFKAALERTEA